MLHLPAIWVYQNLTTFIRGMQEGTVIIKVMFYCKESHMTGSSVQDTIKEQQIRNLQDRCKVGNIRSRQLYTRISLTYETEKEQTGFLHTSQ